MLEAVYERLSQRMSSQLLWSHIFALMLNTNGINTVKHDLAQSVYILSPQLGYSCIKDSIFLLLPFSSHIVGTRYILLWLIFKNIKYLSPQTKLRAHFPDYTYPWENMYPPNPTHNLYWRSLKCQTIIVSPLLTTLLHSPPQNPISFSILW